jgi:hypothetical protein
MSDLHPKSFSHHHLPPTTVPEADGVGMSASETRTTTMHTILLTLPSRCNSHPAAGAQPLLDPASPMSETEPGQSKGMEGWAVAGCERDRWCSLLRELVLQHLTGLLVIVFRFLDAGDGDLALGVGSSSWLHHCTESPVGWNQEWQ